MFLLRFRKLRDEYDKLEGALRKLGVDPESVVGAQGDDDDDEGEDEGDEDNLYEEDDDEDFHGRGHRGGGGGAHTLQSQISSQGAVEDLLLDDLDPLSLQNRTARLRRHLDILEEVGERNTYHLLGAQHHGGKNRVSDGVVCRINWD